MHNKKDSHTIIGIAIVIAILFLAFLGYRQFGNDVPAPQIVNGNVTETNVNIVPTGSELLGKNDTQKMTPVQVIKKENGLIIEIMEEGTGNPVKSGDTISLDYRGMFTDGKIFDESYARGQKFSFTPGTGMVIAGWEEGVLGMKVGEKRRLTVPSSLGYGPNDYGPIPGGSTLIFDIELHSIN